MLGVAKTVEANGSVDMREVLLIAGGIKVVASALSEDVDGVSSLAVAPDAIESAAAATVVATFESDSFCSLVVVDISVITSLSRICIPVNFFSTFLSNSVFLGVEEVEYVKLLLFNLKKMTKIKMAIMAICINTVIIRISKEISIPNNSIQC